MVVSLCADHGVHIVDAGEVLAGISDPMPTEEERAEMRALDAKLDAFAAMLKESRAVAGGDDISRHPRFRRGVRKTVPLVRELERLGPQIYHPSFSSSHRYRRGKFCR